MRLSDLYKPRDHEGEARVPPTPVPASVPPTPALAAAAPPPAPPRPAAAKPTALHRELITQMRHLIELVQQEQQVPAEPLLALLDQVVASFLQDAASWIGLAHLATPEPYLITHPINVTVLSLALGQGLDYAEARLRALALRAYVHDVGMIKHAHIIEQPRALTPGELAEIAKHPEESATLIERFIPGVGKGVCYAILQEHERLDGTGYPQQLVGGEIEEEMRIIGLIDVYEALTHPRSWRERLTPRQAVDQLLSPDSKGKFDPHLLRLLVTQIGVYPPGTWVTLSTGESGRVLHGNPKTPLRPIIEVMTDPQGEPLEAPRHVDLSQTPTYFIKDFAGYDEPS